MILAQHGNIEESGEGYKVVSVYSAPTSAYMYGIRNEGEGTLEITLDLSGCDNM